MKLSVETYVLREIYDDKEAIEMIKETGYDCYDYSMFWAKGEKNMLDDDWREKAHKLREYSDKIGIICNQAHAPFDIQYTDAFSETNANYEELVRSMEVAALLGAKTIIVHAIKKNLPKEVNFYELNRKFYKSLLPYCQKFNICVSVENLFNIINDRTVPVLSDPEEHMNFVESLKSDYINICVDVGHSAITGQRPENVITSMNKRYLKALHIHDNDFISDRHILPYTGKIDWESVCEALAQIGYEGDLTFEIFGFLKKLPQNLIFDGLVYAEKVGRELIRKVEGVENSVL